MRWFDKPRAACTFVSMNLRMQWLVLAVGMCWIGTATAQAESRIFTSTAGQTKKGELVSVNGDQVTIKWEDGTTATLKTSDFSGADNTYFKEHASTAPKADPADPAPPATPSPAEAALPADALVIQALVDGPSELRVKKGGIYWINGRNAKPGKYSAGYYPTYVGGVAWVPVWSNSKPRGKDKTAVHSVNIPDPLNLDFKLITVGVEKNSPGIEKRDEIKLSVDGEEFSIEIPDRQAGARWYKFALIPKKGSAKP